MDIQLQLAKCADRSEVAHLIYHSTNVWYQQHGLAQYFSLRLKSAIYLLMYNNLILTTTG